MSCICCALSAVTSIEWSQKSPQFRAGYTAQASSGRYYGTEQHDGGQDELTPRRDV